MMQLLSQLTVHLPGTIYAQVRSYSLNCTILYLYFVLQYVLKLNCTFKLDQTHQYSIALLSYIRISQRNHTTPYGPTPNEWGWNLHSLIKILDCCLRFRETFSFVRKSRSISNHVKRIYYAVNHYKPREHDTKPKTCGFCGRFICRRAKHCSHESQQGRFNFHENVVLQKLFEFSAVEAREEWPGLVRSLRGPQTEGFTTNLSRPGRQSTSSHHL